MLSLWPKTQCCGFLCALVFLYVLYHYVCFQFSVFSPRWQERAQRELRAVAHGLGQAAREEQHVQQRLEGVGVQVGDREAELLHVLRDALVGVAHACNQGRAPPAWFRCCLRPIGA